MHAETIAELRDNYKVVENKRTLISRSVIGRNMKALADCFKENRPVSILHPLFVERITNWRLN